MPTPWLVKDMVGLDSVPADGSVAGVKLPAITLDDFPDGFVAPSILFAEAGVKVGTRQQYDLYGLVEAYIGECPDVWTVKARKAVLKWYSKVCKSGLVVWTAALYGIGVSQFKAVKNKLVDFLVDGGYAPLCVLQMSSMDHFWSGLSPSARAAVSSKPRVSWKPDTTNDGDNN